MTELFEATDAWDRRLALRATGRLADLNRAGVLVAADVHVAQRVGNLVGEQDPDVLLAVALVVRAVRAGSVCVDLGTVGESIAVAAPEARGLLPDPAAWLDRVAASPLVGGAIRVDQGLVYLDRYWRLECAVVDDLLARLDRPPPSVDQARLAAGLDRLFPGETYAEQRAAADASVRRWTSVVTGGPGTGKTTTLSRLLALLVDLQDGPLRVALAAPTGKAAARMTQALVGSVADAGFPAQDRPAVETLSASTLHRLLGTRPDNATRFRRHRGNRLPHDVVVVDETSMVSLTLMARLLEAVRPDARVVLVGDADQLASVEAGAVLKDVVTGFAERRPTPVSQLTVSHRFGDEIGELARAIRDADDDAAWALLQRGSSGVELVSREDEDRVRDIVAPSARRLREHALGGDTAGALAELDRHRLLCAHREGPFGVGAWNRQVERWLQQQEGRDWLPERYAGQPLIVSENDYGLQLWNGDTGVVVGDARDDQVAVFDTGGGGGVRRLSLARLPDVQTAHAMTVHRSQGSQFAEVSVLLPEPTSRVLNRELFYTAVTRARSVVRVIGTEESVRAAVTRTAQRATGLAPRLR